MLQTPGGGGDRTDGTQLREGGSISKNKGRTEAGNTDQSGPLGFPNCKGD